MITTLKNIIIGISLILAVSLNQLHAMEECVTDSHSYEQLYTRYKSPNIQRLVNMYGPTQKASRQKITMVTQQDVRELQQLHKAIHTQIQDLPSDNTKDPEFQQLYELYTVTAEPLEHEYIKKLLHKDQIMFDTAISTYSDHNNPYVKLQNMVNKALNNTNLTTLSLKACLDLLQGQEDLSQSNPLLYRLKQRVLLKLNDLKTYQKRIQLKLDKLQLHQVYKYQGLKNPVEEARRPKFTTVALDAMACDGEMIQAEEPPHDGIDHKAAFAQKPAKAGFNLQDEAFYKEFDSYDEEITITPPKKDQLLLPPNATRTPSASPSWFPFWQSNRNG